MYRMMRYDTIQLHYDVILQYDTAYFDTTLYNYNMIYYMTQYDITQYEVFNNDECDVVVI